MSLVKKLSDKLDSILKEEKGVEDDNFEDQTETKIYNSRQKTKKNDIKTKDDWEDEFDKITFSTKNFKNHQPIGPLFPGLQAYSKKTHPMPYELANTLNNEHHQDDNFKETNLKLDVGSSLLIGLQNSEGFVEAKMVELSKKIRELNAQLMSTQNKLKIAENRLASQESEQKETVLPKEEVSEDKITKLKTELKEFSDKFQACNAKLCDARNQIQQHKHEIKLLHKALASEVGENYSIHTITSDGWRGRAQQICSLQQKVFELMEKLSLTSIPSIEKSLSAVQSFEKSQDKERILSLTKEVEELKVQLNDMKNKGDQARARVKVLSSDIAVLKGKYDTLVVKNEEDVKLMNTLSSKLANISQKNHEREINFVKKYDDQLAALNIELKQERVKTEQFQKIVCERDSKIQKLEEKILECHQNHFQSFLVKNEDFGSVPQLSTGFHTERPTTQQSIFSNPSYSQSIEVERLRLMELITVLNKRLDEERKTLDKIQDQLRLEKQKSAKLETKVNKLELERVGRSYRRPTPRLETLNKFEVDSLKDNCALMNEKCLALESRLERMRLEKEEDSRAYVRMVEEARAALREQIRKGSSCSASSIS